MNNVMIKNSFDVLRSVLYALVISVFMVLGLALMIKLTGMNTNTVTIINQAIKIISMLIGIFIGMKEFSMGAAKGALSGFLYIMLSFLVFNLLAGQDFSLKIFDVLIGIVVGLISGIITVNMKNKT